jgi:hypothetical protein|tara:strand:+ start:6456 stop:6896 length:441 start_codon:yes stop_codon:yes gene_type:complete
MARINSRTKGANGERQVVHLLQPIINEEYELAGLAPPLLQRNQMQSHQGGYDLVGIDWIALEVKFYKEVTEAHITKWWKQCWDQATNGEMPVLIYRQNKGKWKVRMNVALQLGESSKQIVTPAIITVDAFTHWFRYRIKAELGTLI